MQPTIVLVLAESPEAARKWIAAQPRDPRRPVTYAYANRWSAFLGRSQGRGRTYFARVGEWWRHDANEEAYWWARDNGFEEWKHDGAGGR